MSTPTLRAALAAYRATGAIPSHTDLAERANVGRATASRHLEEAVGAGVLLRPARGVYTPRWPAVTTAPIGAVGAVLAALPEADRAAAREELGAALPEGVALQDALDLVGAIELLEEALDDPGVWADAAVDDGLFEELARRTEAADARLEALCSGWGWRLRGGLDEVGATSGREGMARRLEEARRWVEAATR